MKKILFILMLATSVAVAQEPVLDSLKTALENHAERDTIRFRLLVQASEYAFSTPDISKHYIDQALALAISLDYERGVAESHSLLANFFTNNMEFAPAVEHGTEALRKYEALNDLQGLYSTYEILVGMYASSGDYDKASEYMDKMLALGEKKQGLVQYDELYYNMGYLRMKQGKFTEGIDLVSKAIALNIQTADYYQLSGCYFLLAKGKEGLGDQKGAMREYQRCIAVAKLSDHPSVLSNIASANEGLASICIRLREFDRASAHLDTATDAARQINSANMMLKIYADRASLNEGRGNLREALRYERLKKALSDSVLNVEKAALLAEAQTKYESEKKENTIAMLEQEMKAEERFRLALIVGVVLLILAAVAIVMLQRSKTSKAKQLLAFQESLNARLVEVDKTKSRFFANISHEFRTPLTLIITPVEEKLSHDDLSREERIAFQSIRRSAHRLLALVNQLLELSKLESGNMKLQPQPGDLHSFLLPVLSSFDSLANAGMIHYSKAIEGSSPAVLFDADKLEKIINNLVGNAFKFSPRGGEVAVNVRTREQEGLLALTLTVTNSGGTIEPDSFDRIFEPFFQGDDRSSKGTGLGLAIVRELVRLHGGSLQVQSDVQHGTKFLISLSFVRSEAASKAEEAIVQVIPISENGNDENTGQSDPALQTVLVVEDNPEVRMLIRQSLQNNYNVVEADTGKAGFELAVSNPVDLVVSDVMMPVMSGVELCHLLKNDERTSHVPVVLLTARADQESRLEGLRTGADDYVVKPFNIQELDARIANLLNQRKKLVQKYGRQLAVNLHDITVTPMDERFMERLIQLMEKYIDDPTMSVDRLTDELGMSRPNLYRKIKAITGLPVNEFIQDFRLRRAAVLISKKSDRISQIAFQVGFADQSYFTKCFKKKFGKTPSEFAQVDVPPDL